MSRLLLVLVEPEGFEVVVEGRTACGSSFCLWFDRPTAGSFGLRFVQRISEERFRMPGQQICWRSGHGSSILRSMLATIELKPEEAEFLKQSTDQDDVGAALREAANEYIRYRKRMNLKEMTDTVEFDESSVKAMQDAED